MNPFATVGVILIWESLMERTTECLCINANLVLFVTLVFLHMMHDFFPVQESPMAPEMTPDMPVIKEKSLLNETVQKVAQDIRIMKRKELSAKQEKTETGTKETEQEDNSFVCPFCIQVSCKSN